MRSSAETSSKPSPHEAPRPAIPPLANGDRLDRDEFERRYEAMPDLKRAELIEGRVYVPSPTRQREHGHPHVHLATWLGNYEAATPGVEAGDNATIRLDLDNEPQPDLFLRIAAAEGQTRIDEDGYVEGAPELVAEVAASSASYDLHEKLHAYRRNGVREYVVWRVLDRALDWFVLSGTSYVPLEPDSDGLVKSHAFPGLWLDREALLRGDLKTVLARIQDGVSSGDHPPFVESLRG